MAVNAWYVNEAVNAWERRFVGRRQIYDETFFAGKSSCCNNDGAYAKSANYEIVVRFFFD